MKVLVVGGSCLLGSYLLRSVPEGVDAEFTWYTTYQNWCAHQMDICNKSQVQYVFSKVKPQTVIHMAAVGNVDWCQDNYGTAFQINVGGLRNVLEVAKDYEAQVLMTSTNAVYSGENPPYAEDAEQKPVNAYGKIKKQAERFMAGYRHKWQIVRLFLLYGWEPQGARDNWASSAARKLHAGMPMKVVDDVFYQPTWAADAARAVWKVLLDGEPGAYNVAGTDRVSLYQFVLEVANMYPHYDKNLISPVSISQFDIAPRPIDSSYDLGKSQALGIWCRGIKEGLEGMRNELA